MNSFTPRTVGVVGYGMMGCALYSRHPRRHMTTPHYPHVTKLLDTPKHLTQYASSSNRYS